ncbi:hypothetical protein GLGCALEP_02116 [Pseudomonas sp. MM221]|nr:hypothetical protein DBADOPDK_02063 [Pseudomonas sp. MM223]CAI3798992.1 hypothetical protein GLGCALEP_02116 [Pseudomonas sp. MM221]
MTSKSNVSPFPRRHSGEDDGHGGAGGGGSDLEARVARLETHVEYIRRDLDVVSADLKEVHNDLTSIKRRMAYLGGAGFVVAAIIAWIINNRFDEVVTMLTKASGQ